MSATCPVVSTASALPPTSKSGTTCLSIRLGSWGIAFRALHENTSPPLNDDTFQQVQGLFVTRTRDAEQYTALQKEVKELSQMCEGLRREAERARRERADELDEMRQKLEHAERHAKALAAEVRAGQE